VVLQDDEREDEELPNNRPWESTPSLQGFSNAFMLW
jgi:hypothetical protein